MKVPLLDTYERPRFWSAGSSLLVAWQEERYSTVVPSMFDMCQPGYWTTNTTTVDPNSGVWAIRQGGGGHC